MSFKKFLAKFGVMLLLGATFIGGSIVYAMTPPPVGGFFPNQTLDPDCAPGDTDCFVRPVQPWFGTDDNAVATENTEDIFTLGNVGIQTQASTSTSLNIFNLDNADGITVNALVANADILLNAQGSIAAESNLFINMDSDNNSTANGIVFGANAKGSGADELVRITESGRLGVGLANSPVNSPLTALHVAGDVDAGPAFSAILEDSNPFGNFSLILRNTTQTATTTGITDLRFESADPNQTSGFASINYRNSLGGLSLNSNGNGAAATDLFIDLDGNIGIGTVIPTSSLHVVGLPTTPPNGSVGGAVCADTAGAFYIDASGTCN